MCAPLRGTYREPPPPPPAHTAAAAVSKVAVPKRAAGDRVIASPYAKKLALEAGLDLARVLGTGPGGRVEAADVEKAKKEGVVRRRSGTSLRSEVFWFIVTRHTVIVVMLVTVSRTFVVAVVVCSIDIVVCFVFVHIMLVIINVVVSPNCPLLLV